MRDPARMGLPGRTATMIALLGFAMLAGVALTAMQFTPAAAYDQYSLDGTTGNCATCHGDFRSSPYISQHDQVSWGTSLHDGHRQTMLSGDCSTCHFTARFPVLLNSSAGGTGFSPISCLGCHGRAEPNSGNAVTGAGLRQHHYRSGITVCGSGGCHTDANPTSFTVAAESVKPPYYFTPDTAHPNKPTDPCNRDNKESLVAPPLGLDNDGDLGYDTADPDCSPVGVGDLPKPLSLALEGASPNPGRGLVCVWFTLSSQAPAWLELFDSAGRRLVRRDVSAMGAGRHSMDLAWGRALRPGAYLVRLTQSGVSLKAKAIVTQ